jgi:hypothetical protein
MDKILGSPTQDKHPGSATLISRVSVLKVISRSQCCRSVAFLFGSGSTPLTNRSGSESCYFVIDLQDSK